MRREGNSLSKVKDRKKGRSGHGRDQGRKSCSPLRPIIVRWRKSSHIIRLKTQPSISLDLSLLPSPAFSSPLPPSPPTLAKYQRWFNRSCILLDPGNVVLELHFMKGGWGRGGGLGLGRGLCVINIIRRQRWPLTTLAEPRSCVAMIRGG